jgi:hypothetical protein
MKKYLLVLLFIFSILAPPLMQAEEADWKDELAYNVSEATNYNHYEVREYAAKLSKKYEAEDEFIEVWQVYKHIESRWSYNRQLFDFDRMKFKKASDIVEGHLRGDSDDFAIGICSIFNAMGKPSRIVISYEDDRITNIYAEVLVPKSTLERYTQNFESPIWWDWDLNGGWVNLDFKSGRPGGPFIGGDQVIFVSPSGAWWEINRKEIW